MSNLQFALRVYKTRTRWHVAEDRLERFPYVESRWSHDAEQKRRWLDALERTGVEAVRIRLVQFDGGSPGALSIGVEQTMTKGFAEEWLSWKVEQRERASDASARTNTIISVVAAGASVVAAVAAIFFGG